MAGQDWRLKDESITESMDAMRAARATQLQQQEADAAICPHCGLVKSDRLADGPAKGRCIAWAWQTGRRAGGWAHCKE